MTRAWLKLSLVLTASASGLMPQTGARAASAAPERFQVGKNAGGEVCSAARQWTEGEGPIRVSASQPFSLTCRGEAAAEEQGYVSGATIGATLERCGSPATAMLRAIGPVEVRKCFDSRLGKSAVDIRFERGGRQYQGAATEVSLGALENALRVIALGAAPPREQDEAQQSLELASVPAGPAVSGAIESVGNTSEAALSEGIAALQGGRMLDASRILNDALRQFAAANPASLIDLRLAAGLADSNISQFDAAEQHFAVARQLLASSPNLPGASAELQQLDVYEGIHLINQHRWEDAVARLSRRSAANQTLQDPATLSRLNQEPLIRADAQADSGGDRSLQSTLVDEGILRSLLVEAQRYWALSVAYLALGRTDEAEAALAAAADVARGPVQRDRIAWLNSTIERQQGRINVRKGEMEPALASFDCAIAAIQGASAPRPGACLIAPRSEGVSYAAYTPLLVEAQLERASIASRDPERSQREVLATYRTAVESIPALSGTGPVSLAVLERYFALLTQAPASAERDEEYFRAMQAIGEPAIAGEMAQLERAVTVDSNVGEQMRERSILRRDRTSLGFQISAAGDTDSPELEALKAERARVSARLDEVESKLNQVDALKQLDDSPATVAEVRDVLAPGEVYLKLVALNSAMFGIAIGPAQTAIYRLDGSRAQIERLAADVLGSARSSRDEAGNASINVFNVAGAADLFKIIAGPAEPMLSAARQIIYNPAGTLRQLPLAILVNDPDLAQNYSRQRAGNYSKVGFVGRKAETSVALSPRSFVGARKNVTPSKAANAFLGIGENAPSRPAAGSLGNQKMPFDCSMTYRDWAAVLDQYPPISAHEIDLAGAALGIGNPTEIVRENFTDQRLVEGLTSAKLDQFQVVHFATHGLAEQRYETDGCVMHVPPSLITTLEAPTADGQIKSDGLLSFDEVAKLDLDANLVVLSACDTSAGASTLTARQRGLESSSAALDGLVRSFLAARARSVLATFWSVPVSEETDALMEAFYRAGRTSTISGALREAQLTLMQQPTRYSHPYYWGAYFLVGDGSKTMLTGTQVAARSESKKNS